MSNLRADLNAKIIFIHQGHNWYLPYALHQARHASLDSEVVLLGPSAYAGIKNVPLHDLQGSAGEMGFRKSYLHMSTNPEWFELFCFLRWFYLLAYMRAYDVPAVFYFDSDVLLFSSVDEVAKIYETKNARCAYMIPEGREGTWVASAHMSYWTREALGEFCLFLTRCYGDRERLKMLQDKHDEFLRSGGIGGINDMTLLYLFWREHAKDIVNFSVERDGTVFDFNVNAGRNYRPDEYKVQGSMKQMVWMNGHPFFIKADGEGRLVRAHAMHFQGKAKGYMPQYYAGGGFKNKILADLIGLGYRWRRNIDRRKFSRVSQEKINMGVN